MKKEELPLISVIVPIYNVAEYLPECLDSIIKQSYKNLEIILLDDGSTDDSGRIVDDYARKYKTIKAIHQKHMGVASARENGVSAVTGEWVSFVDPDDYVKEDFIESLYKVAAKENADIVSCGLKSFSTDPNCLLKKTPEWPKGKMTGREMVNEMMKHRYPAYLPVNLFKADLFKKGKVSFPIGREYEDVGAKVKLLFYANKVVFLDKRLYMYRIHSGSITGKNFTKSRYDDLIAAVDDIRMFIEKTGEAKDFVYMDYYEFSSLVILLNYLAREKKIDDDMKKYWKTLGKRIRRMYSRVVFPNIKSKIIGGLTCVLSYNRKLYSWFYLLIKKTQKY